VIASARKHKHDWRGGMTCGGPDGCGAEYRFSPRQEEELRARLKKAVTALSLAMSSGGPLDHDHSRTIWALAVDMAGEVRAEEGAP
jgi:hypothetical protein